MKSSDMVFDVTFYILKNWDFEVFEKAKKYAECTKEIQNRIRIEDYFNFMEYIKNVELKKLIPEIGYIAHSTISNLGEWKSGYLKRDIRDLDECEELITNAVGVIMNSCSIPVGLNFLKKPNLNESIQKINEAEAKEFVKKNKDEIFRYYSEYLKKEKEVTERIYS